MTSRDMRQDREADSGKTPHYSKYREKSEKKELQGALEETQRDFFPTERFDSPVYPISIFTGYKRNNVILYAKAPNCQVHSCLIRSYRGETHYGINKRTEDPNEKKRTTESNFQKLYETSWIQDNRLAQVQLHIIEQAIGAHKKNIEDHLGINI